MYFQYKDVQKFLKDVSLEKILQFHGSRGSCTVPLHVLPLAEQSTDVAGLFILLLFVQQGSCYVNFGNHFLLFTPTRFCQVFESEC